MYPIGKIIHEHILSIFLQDIHMYYPYVISICDWWSNHQPPSTNGKDGEKIELITYNCKQV